MLTPVQAHEGCLSAEVDLGFQISYPEGTIIEWQEALVLFVQSTWSNHSGAMNHGTMEGMEAHGHRMVTWVERCQFGEGNIIWKS